jgi:diguanylate cyclase (GGDEF)-like protein
VSDGRPLQLARAGAQADRFPFGELGLITRSLALRSGAEIGLLAGFNPVERIVEVLCAWGAAGLDDLPPLPADGFVGRVLEYGRVAVEPLDPEQDASFGVAASGVRLTHAAGVAVRPPGGPPGALCVGFSEAPHRDPELIMWTLEGYARLAALCLHDVGTLDGMLAAARLDGLTGCLNHRAILAELEHEIGRCRRRPRNLACCFIDLDRFKQLNDHHGHVRGSRVLADVAAALRRAVRLADTVGRYGGDEFVAVLPETDERTARLLGERLRLAIAAQAIDGAGLTLDASVGVAQWRVGWTADDVLEAADVALLNAKAAGGGIVMAAGDVAAYPRSRFARARAASAAAGPVVAPGDLAG